MFYILDGHDVVPVSDIREWGLWFETHYDDRIVASNEVDGLLISTVFLGLDHSFGDGKPLLFETMIFNQNSEHPWRELAMDRYSDWIDAEEGHAIAVRYVKEGRFDQNGSD